MNSPRRDADEIDAVILDLDGVITQTAALHRAAWKEAFDELMSRGYPDQPPFDADHDYRRYVDGMPRLDGARSFLASRGIELPEGADSDTLEDATVRGIGNSKNHRFHELLKQRGAEVFQDAVDAIDRWKQDGAPVAVVSSSRNCLAILDSVGLADVFDARVDGVTLQELDLPGKPAPDMYLEAARRIGRPPSRCGVFEDALAGVQAARRGGFGLVVGVDRRGDAAEALRQHGADIVIESFEGFGADAGRGRSARSAPLLLERLEAFRHSLEGRQPVLFLDYDGTLTPIVARPELARIDEQMRSLIRRTAEAVTVAVVSGRDLEDVRRLVGIADIVYAGSHGFDIRGPDGLAIEHDVGSDAVPALDAAERQLQAGLAGVEGAQIERKKFSIAVHYRNVDAGAVDRVRRAVDDAIAGAEGLRLAHGKKVLEVQPDLDWNKGRAVLWLLDALGVDPVRSTPIYIGDDVTDEDAFAALRGRGVGVLVAEEDQQTAAGYRLRDVDEVRRFLQWLGRDLIPQLKQETA
ncbi:MAG: trehalose-phosphatase [Phycisphaerales bacterium JB039]